jgi:RND family efflux transporter MFP subunit
MRKQSMQRVSIVMLVAALMLPAAALAQFGGTPPVELSEARLTTMAPTMQVAGTVVSRSDAFLSAEVDGRLIEVADIGTRVEAGDVVARIEDTTLALRARELESEITRAESRLRFLEAELARFERLAETNLAALSQIEQTRSERDIASSDLAVVRARLDQIEDQIDRTRITAPFPGVVAERVAQAGERVAVGTRVVRMVNPMNLEVVARAPLSYYRFVQPGDELAITVAGEVLHAPLRTTVSVGDEARHVFELRLDVEAPLPVGQTVRVTVPTADVREVLAVPRDALVLRGDGIAIFIVDEDNKARRIRVTTGIGEGEWIEVRGPIQEGDRVVIRGNERLRPGQEVSVRES